ncbi:iron ABC transporter substrate-binding protein [Nocardioides marmoriginsengisoli]|uniref:Iron ABC transporter substrate-binding protein n=1 Tax=Nocardioides marmoriginsengisoli TaxID=661483 RepID=A0A3N0CNH4_9ACTN|nr:ABC transporter substrate-binding protein [Nocardioides marmoriginsengisoli]RNL64900.1 iron ABC transporter substrate-binding protein [Nocardioides marmoriginsengisoli]
MRIRPHQALLTLTVAGLVLSGCAGAPKDDDTAKASAGYPVTVSSCGFETTVKAKPERAITMNQGATEVVLALGAEDQLAGTAYLDDAVADRWKPAYDSVKVLSKEYPDGETVLAAKPDFVYGSYASAFDAKSAGTQESLAKLGIGSFLSLFGCGENKPSEDVSFASVWKEVRLAGEVFGAPDRAAAIEKEQQAALADLAAEKPADGQKIFWYDSGDKTAFAGAGEGGPQLVIDAIGGSNIFADLDGGWKDVSWEKVIAADPDVIVLADASWSTAAEKIELLEKDPVLSKLRAVREKKFVTLPFSETTPGVRLVDGAEHVAEQVRQLNAG